MNKKWIIYIHSVIHKKAKTKKDKILYEYVKNYIQNRLWKINNELYYKFLSKKELSIIFK